MKGIVNICNIYILSWCIYLSQGSLGIRGSVISQLLLVFVLAVSVYYVFYAIRHYNIGPFLRAAFVFFVILEVYGVFLIMGGERLVFSRSLNVVNKMTYLKGIATSILPIFPFYVFTRKGYLTEEIIRKCIWILLIVATYYFFFTQNQILMKLLIKGSEEVEDTNNGSYLFLALLPFTVFYRHKLRLQFALMGYCMIFILSGYKRGAILIGVLVLVIITYDTLKHSKGNYKFRLFHFTYR